MQTSCINHSFCVYVFTLSFKLNHKTTFRVFFYVDNLGMVKYITTTVLEACLFPFRRQSRAPESIDNINIPPSSSLMHVNQQSLLLEIPIPMKTWRWAPLPRPLLKTGNEQGHLKSLPASQSYRAALLLPAMLQWSIFQYLNKGFCWIYKSRRGGVSLWCRAGPWAMLEGNRSPLFAMHRSSDGHLQQV